MTVKELIDRILLMYPGASPEALAMYRPVFQARFQHREGKPLEAAASEVFASFKATARQPFPIPVDFEQHLAEITPKTASSGPKIDFDAHRERKHRLLAEWWEKQGNGIRGARGPKIASACSFKARDIAEMRAWNPDPQPVILTAKEIQICEDHVVSSERMATYGAHCIRTENEAAWQAQMDELRPLVRAGRSPSKERKAKSDEKFSHQNGRATKRVAELARAKREQFMAEREKGEAA